MRALIVGGSGYLGQFVIRAMLDAGYERVDYTYASNPLPEVCDACTGHVANVASGEGVREAIDAVLRSGGLDVVVNCAAISSPGACEKDPETANATNVPKQLLVALRERFPPVTRGDTGEDPAAKKPVFVHLSTDQVYCGETANNLEGHGKHIAPVNAYGRSKLAAEKMVLESWPHAQTVVLRSSIITGPQSPFKPVKRPLFLDFVADALRGGNPTTFFEDEFRCPIAAVDLARHILVLAAAEPGTKRGVFNAGGPERLSRVDMAKKGRRGFAGIVQKRRREERRVRRPRRRVARGHLHGLVQAGESHRRARVRVGAASEDRSGGAVHARVGERTKRCGTA
jgi:dTDP-4-dehydrorhamnose reductase